MLQSLCHQTLLNHLARDVVYKSADDHPSGHKLMSIESIHPMYDPLMYVLMFPFGNKGFLLMHIPSQKHFQNSALLCSITSTD